jgi:hypothetical protein
VSLGVTKRLLPLLLTIAVATSLPRCSTPEGEVHPFLSYLPQAGEAGSWRPEDEPQHVEGDDLFLLINGGAEIYHEYGFEQAVVQSYIDANDRSLNLEIYEMSNPSAAYGMFTFKKGESGRDLDVGDEASLQDYYLNVRKGNFLVTVIGFDTEKETTDGLEALARSVAGKIAEGGDRPKILELLPDDGVEPGSVKYLKGNLALYNAHEFATGNLFGLREGLTAKMGDEQVFLFGYESENEAEERLANAWNALSEEEKYQDVRAGDDTCTAVNGEGRHLSATTADRYILIAVGANVERAKETLGKLQSSVSK